MSDTNRPAGKINLYPVSAAIWRNENDRGVFYAVSFEKRFKDGSGKWQSSSSFAEGDLLLLAKLANLAHDEIQENHRRDRHAARDDTDAS